MKAVENKPAIPPELRAELQRTLADATAGVRDSSRMREAAERMDRMREANRRRFGSEDIGVEIIRGIRDEQ
jgi:hypothetical protein